MYSSLLNPLLVAALAEQRLSHPSATQGGLPGVLQDGGQP